MDIAVTQTHMQSLAEENPVVLLGVIETIKNIVIGNYKQKNNFVMLGAVQRLLKIIAANEDNVCLCKECMIVLTSLAKKSAANSQSLLDNNVLPTICQALKSQDIQYVEACLRCFRVISTCYRAPGYSELYDALQIVPLLLEVMPRTLLTQETVITIIGKHCRTSSHQQILYDSGILPQLLLLLSSLHYSIVEPALYCLSMLTYKNEDISRSLDSDVINLMADLMRGDRPQQIRVGAATCLAYMCRAGAIEPSDVVVTYKTLPTLVRLCSREFPVSTRIQAAETLAYLIEEDVNLQQIASISDHLIHKMALYFRLADDNPDTITARKFSDELETLDELKETAFKVLASLAANNEAIRKKVVGMDGLMDHISCSLEVSVPKVRLAACSCLHSLSRSVQLLRTSFQRFKLDNRNPQDSSVWKPLIAILREDEEPSEEMLRVVTATMCNLLLEFSPCKETVLEVVPSLIKLTKREDVSVRVNSVWALMNMTFQVHYRAKDDIISMVIPSLRGLISLLSDCNHDVVMKALGLFRNLLTSSLHSDLILSNQHSDMLILEYGSDLISACMELLECRASIDAKEQVLCFLGNLSDCVEGRRLVMEDKTCLGQIIEFLLCGETQIQRAAVIVVMNLVRGTDISIESRLRDKRVHKILQELLSTKDPVLMEKFSQSSLATFHLHLVALNQTIFANVVRGDMASLDVVKGDMASLDVTSFA